MSPVNEHITENIVRDYLRKQGYYDNDNILIEEQSSQNLKIANCLKTASKKGTNKQGFPEFIISFKNRPDDIMIVECKAETTKHESQDRKSPVEYAVDGVLWYASHLKDTYNVTAIAISGDNEKDVKISSFLWLKNNFIYKNIQDKIFLKPQEVINVVEKQSQPFTEEELVKKAIEYNAFLHRYSIPEVERCTLISAILVALQDEPFLESYKVYTSNKALITAMLSACKNILDKNLLTKDSQGNDIPDNARIDIVIHEYSKFQNNTDFNSVKRYNPDTKKDEINTILRDFIDLLRENIFPHLRTNQFDVLGKFYTSFIRYAGSDKKTGLVLTPNHITDFFCDIAKLNENSVVFDPCCGTGGFLVSAMNYMIDKSGNNTDKHKEIKSNQLVGIEKRADMFSHACSNMMMRGDGKSHIFMGDCFLNDFKYKAKELKPTRGFLNPPYDVSPQGQLEFIENTIDCIETNGICVAICQMSTATSNDKEVIEVRKRLLNKNTLLGVLTMPDELFNPSAGVNTCILIFEVGQEHNNKSTSFFGYFKDDGFEKTKNKGRIDLHNKWNNIKEQWLNLYRDKKDSKISINVAVDHSMEWCAEAYMETDYSQLTQEDFETTLKNYASFLVQQGTSDD